MRETPFKQKVEKFLEEKEAWFIKYWAGAKFTKEGIPDVLACIYGRFYGLELKGDGGHPTMLQLVNLRNIRNAGGIGLLLYPNDFAQFQKFIEDPAEKNNHCWYRQNIDKQNELFEKMKA